MRTPAEAGGLVGPHLQAFFAEHLLAHKRASPQTIVCYRDPFRYLPIPTATSCLLSHHQTATALVVSADIGAATASTFRRGIRNATTALVRAPIRICDTPIAADAMPA